MSLSPALSADLASFIQSGVSIGIGSRNAALTPEGARVWAVRVEADRTHLEAFVYAPSAGPTLSNLEDNGQMALVFDQPRNHEAWQIKGRFVGWRHAADSERDEVFRQVSALSESLCSIGLPRELMTGAQLWPCLVLRMRVTDVFGQNPGPGAGERVP